VGDGAVGCTKRSEADDKEVEEMLMKREGKSRKGRRGKAEEKSYGKNRKDVGSREIIIWCRCVAWKENAGT
jgi:hypothetical protein